MPKQYKNFIAAISFSIMCVFGLLLFLNNSARRAAASLERPTQADAVAISFWHSYVGDKETYINTLIAEFESLYPTITVETESHYPTVSLFNTVLEQIKAGEETPNVVTGYPNLMWNYARFDALRFLDDFTVDPDLGLDIPDFHPPALGDNRLAEYDDQLGALPLSSSGTDLLYYNADMLASVGVGVPQTWDAFYTACISLTTETVSGTILHSNQTQFLTLLWTRGGVAYSPDLKRGIFDDSSGIAALQLYRNLLDGGYARMVTGSYEDQDKFADGQAAFVMGSSSSIPFLRNSIDEAGVVNDWGVAPLPADPGHKAVFAASGNIMILKSTPEKEHAAWLLLRWITERDQDARRAAEMGQYPVRISASTHPSITEKMAADLQYAQAYQHLSDYGRNQTVLLGLAEIFGEFRNAMDHVLYDDQPVTDTLNTAAANVTGILALTGPDAATITPEGGSLVYTNTLGLASTTTFPPGALGFTTTVAYVPISDLPSDALSFALIPNMVFSVPVSVTIQYRDEDVVGMDEDRLRMYNYNWGTNTWTDADPCGGYLRDPENNVLTAIICHFSDHALADWLYKVYQPLITNE